MTGVYLHTEAQCENEIPLGEAHKSEFIGCMRAVRSGTDYYFDKGWLSADIATIVGAAALVAIAVLLTVILVRAARR